jgi:hypothetical protein
LTEVIVEFKFPVEQSSGEDVNNYSEFGPIDAATRDALNTKIVTLDITSNPMDFADLDTLEIDEVGTTAGDLMIDVQSFVFGYNNSTPNLVITEFLYNDTTGSDTLEFIEIMSIDPVTAELGALEFVEGIDFLFPSLTLDSGDVVVVAKYAAEINAHFGTSVTLEWNDAENPFNGLNNFGEDIVLVNSEGTIIDSLFYDDAGPWPFVATSGEDKSLVLCDPTADNSDATNWEFAEFSLGINNVRTIFGSPEIANCDETAICGGAPSAEAGASQAVCAGESVSIGGSPTATGGVAPYIYAWTPSAGLDDDSISNPTTAPVADTTVYTVIVTDARNCTDEDSLEVTVISDVSAPTALCQDVTVALDGSGQAVVVPGDVDNGSTDDCSINLAFHSQLNNFEDNTIQGWVNGTNTADPVNIADGGPNGTDDNYLVATSDGSGSGGKMTIFNISQWLTDLSGMVAINMDLNNTGANDLQMRIQVNGPGGNFVSTNAVAVANGSGWQNASFSLAAADMTGAGNLSTTLASPTKVWLFHNTSATITNSAPLIIATLCVDNIRDSVNTSFSCSDVGVAPVTLMAYDNAGNTATCSANITIEDNAAPVISGCPGNISTGLDPASCTTTVSWTAPAATDNCSSTLTGSHNSGDSFSQGTVTVTYSAVDDAANSATCSFTITVNDNEAPVISNCPGNINSCGASPVWVPPTAADNCSVSSFSRDQTSGSFFNPNTTTVTYTATDDAGNSATCSFDVTVNPLPTADAGADVTISSGGNATLGGIPTATNGTPGYTYQWFNLAGGGTISTVANPTVSPIITTEYQAYVIDTNGCAGTDVVVVTVIAPFTTDKPSRSELEANQAKSVNENFEKLVLFPNPGPGIFYLDIFQKTEKETETSIEVFNVVGQLVYIWKGLLAGQMRHEMNLNEQSAGQYFVKVKTKGTELRSSVFIVK